MGELGINLPGLLTQLISFSILAFLLYKLLYGPIVNMLDQRAKKIKSGLESADDARKAAADSAVKVEEELAKAHQQGQDLISEARDASLRLRDQEEARVRKQVEEILERAKNEISQERAATIDQVRKEFSDLAIKAAEKVVGQELNPSKHKKLIDQVLEEGFSDRNN